MVEFLRFFPNLETMDLEIDPSFDYEARLGQGDVVNLKLLSSLKSLSLQVSALLARTDPLPWLLAFLSSASPDNALEVLSLTCVIDKPPPSLTIQAFDNTLMGWRSLDELLTRPSFGHLQRFRLDFSLDNPIGDDSPRQIADEFTKQLQSLSKKGVLEVDACEGGGNGLRVS
ncbi:hypothetical protein M413DRAFT_442664 [Hebeloma cylindrosporum]|uniref:Uncharacterized protein n=1 Tax=Hebeloma cylindrosporum TaxID=76867 RepID=A0A0C3CKS7_HEBCY|nr:hypothetical protein M413DRAFT_442664 [Hebeloma cylindrosporum h7]